MPGRGGSLDMEHAHLREHGVFSPMAVFQAGQGRCRVTEKADRRWRIRLARVANTEEATKCSEDNKGCTNANEAPKSTSLRQLGRDDQDIRWRQGWALAAGGLQR